MDEYNGELGILGSDSEQAKRDSEWRRAEERKHEAQEAWLQYDLARIDAIAWNDLKDQLLADKQKPLTTPRQRRDFAAYAAYARAFGWPIDAPQTLFAFLAKHLDHSARVRRLFNSIDAVLRSNSGLVTNDPAIRALMRRLATRKEKTTSQKEVH